MDRPSAIAELPTVHAVAIRLRDHGFDDYAIAVATGIGEDEVPMLLRIAEKKLTNLMCGEARGSSVRDGCHLVNRSQDFPANSAEGTGNGVNES
jgi:hypothetical protein